jgi:hypothetical protein
VSLTTFRVKISKYIAYLLKIGISFSKNLSYNSIMWDLAILQDKSIKIMIINTYFYTQKRHFIQIFKLNIEYNKVGSPISPGYNRQKYGSERIYCSGSPISNSCFQWNSGELIYFTYFYWKTFF